MQSWGACKACKREFQNYPFTYPRNAHNSLPKIDVEMYWSRQLCRVPACGKPVSPGAKRAFPRFCYRNKMRGRMKEVLLYPLYQEWALLGLKGELNLTGLFFFFFFSLLRIWSQLFFCSLYHMIPFLISFMVKQKEKNCSYEVIK